MDSSTGTFLSERVVVSKNPALLLSIICLPSHLILWAQNNTTFNKILMQPRYQTLSHKLFMNIPNNIMLKPWLNFFHCGKKAILLICDNIWTVVSIEI